MDNNKKILFSAMFENYEYGNEIFKTKVHIRDVRTRDGSLVRKKYVFDENIASKIQGYLTLGEYIAFLADVEFKNIEFQYPHGIENKDDLIGNRH